MQVNPLDKFENPNISDFTNPFTKNKYLTFKSNKLYSNFIGKYLETKS